MKKILQVLIGIVLGIILFIFLGLLGSHQISHLFPSKEIIAEDTANLNKLKDITLKDFNRSMLIVHQNKDDMDIYSSSYFVISDINNILYQTTNDFSYKSKILKQHPKTFDTGKEYADIKTKLCNNIVDIFGDEPTILNNVNECFSLSEIKSMKRDELLETLN